MKKRIRYKTPKRKNKKFNYKSFEYIFIITFLVFAYYLSIVIKNYIE